MHLYKLLFLLAGCFFSINSAMAVEFVIAPYGNDYRVYTDGGEWSDVCHPFNIRSFSALVKYDPHGVATLAEILQVTPEDIVKIEDRVGLGAPDTVVTISMIEEALQVYEIKHPPDFYKNFTVYPLYEDNCIHFASLNDNYSEIQRQIGKLSSRNAYFENIALPISNPDITEGNCYTYTATRVLNYEGNEIFRVLDRINEITQAIDGTGFDQTATLKQRSTPILPMEVQDGDWVHYPGDLDSYLRQGDHWGIVRKREGNKFFVESKWGSGPVRLHRVEEVPEVYGSFACFYRLNQEYKNKILNELGAGWRQK